MIDHSVQIYLLTVFDLDKTYYFIILTLQGKNILHNWILRKWCLLMNLNTSGSFNVDKDILNLYKKSFVVFYIILNLFLIYIIFINIL